MEEHVIKYYEDLVLKKSDDYDNIISAIEVVKRFVMRKNRIIVGGLSIELALQSKGQKGIYDEDALMDIDIITDTHFQDAYELAKILYNKGFREISVINALHPSTMKVRVNFKEVCDITYIPTDIINNIPTLQYKGYTIVHPHYTYIDQHRALSIPYENAPFETIMNRPVKDMTRYDLLYDLYPLRILNIKNTYVNLKQHNINISMMHNQCLHGFVALNYWIGEAKTLGFMPTVNFGSSNINALNEKHNQESKLNVSIPEDANFTIYSDNIDILSNNMIKTYNITNIKHYNKFLDKLPTKTVLNDKFDIFNNQQKITAVKIKIKTYDVYIADLQSIMMYLLVNYILLMKIKDGKRSYAFYIAYLTCRDLINFASQRYNFSDINAKNNDKLVRFFPTAETYGVNNFSDSYIVSLHRFKIKNKSTDLDKHLYAQPSNVYDRDLSYKYLSKKYRNFNVNDSKIFDFNGNIILEKHSD